MDPFLKSTSSAGKNFKHTCTDGAPAIINWRQIKVCHTSEERMASCDVFTLFTTPIHSSIKDSTTKFDGSYGRCDQNDQLNLFECKKSPALGTFGRRNGSATCGTFVL